MSKWYQTFSIQGYKGYYAINRAKREFVQMVISADKQVCFTYYYVERLENRYMIRNIIFFSVKKELIIKTCRKRKLVCFRRRCKHTFFFKSTWEVIQGPNFIDFLDFL